MFPAMNRTLILAVALGSLAPVAHAQTWAPRPDAPAADQHRYQLDQNRLATDRLRLQADQRDLEARQHQLDSRLTRMEIEARRQPDPVQPPLPRALRSPEEERVWREGATERRRATQAGVGQIDAWLDQNPD